MEKTVRQFCSILSLGLSQAEDEFALVGQDLAQKPLAKEKSFLLLSYLEENNLLEKISFSGRLFTIYLLVWSEEFGILTRPELKILTQKVFRQIEEMDQRIPKDYFKYFFKKLNNAYVKSVFSSIFNNLHENDIIVFIQGMQDFFNQTLLFYTKEEEMHISMLPMVVGKFFELIGNEISRQNELSFTMDDSDSVILSFGQVYRLFLDSFADELFGKWFEISSTITNQIKKKILLESNINISSKVIYRFMQLIKDGSPLKKKFENLAAKLKKADEDTADEILQDLTQKVFLVLDELELAIYLQRYDEINRNQKTLMNEPTYKQVKKLLASYPMEPHFTRYSIIKFFEFNPLIFLNRIDLAMFVREIALICETLRSDKLEIPDNELRFFIDRILLQTRSLKDFAKMASIFRANVKNFERHEILHNLMEEARMNNRVAGALFSFYLGAMLEVEFGHNIPLPDIEELANRLGSTYSITRRFNITQRIRQILQHGEVDGVLIDKLLKQNLLALKLQHKINEFELYFTFSQYLNIENFYPNADLEDKISVENKFEQLAKEVIQKAYKKIKEVYVEEFRANPDPIERYKILIFAENKVATLIGQELDRRRREPEIKDVGWNEVLGYIEMYASDSIQVYKEQKKTQKINLADLYIEIQSHSTKISVTMTMLKNTLEQLVKDNISNADFDMVQNIQIVYGGIAIHHRENQLNIEKMGFYEFLQDIENNPEHYHQLVLDSLDGKYGDIEVKDPYGKTRTLDYERFAEVNDEIRKLNPKPCADLLSCVIQQDLFKEVYDALTSARNMSKNSAELQSVLEDITQKSSAILQRAKEYYEQASAA